MKPVIVFDMNETLLDMAALDSTFARLFGAGDGAALRKTWFADVLGLFLTATVIGEYRPFGELTDDALVMLARTQGREAADADRAALKEALGRIPAHGDVPAGLTRLRDAGFTLATLTNSTAKSAETLLAFANIRDRFDRVLSVDAVRRYKPAREAYEYAARELGVPTSRILLVAAHGWDVAGAMAAGCEAAFVARPGKARIPGGRTPRFEAPDIEALAGTLVRELANG